MPVCDIQGLSWHLKKHPLFLVAVVVGGDEDQINFVASAETIGDRLKLQADSGNSQWIAYGTCAANGGMTATDPS